MSRKTLDYQPIEPPNPQRLRDNRRLVWVILFMLFPTLLLLSCVILAVIFCHH